MRIKYAALVLALSILLAACSTSLPETNQGNESAEAGLVSRVSVVGTLVSPMGQSVSGETVTLRFPDSGYVETVATDSHGFFVFDYLAASGPFLVTAETKSGLHASSGGIAANSTSKPHLSLKLFRPAKTSLHGAVKNNFGGALANAFVTVVSPHTREEATVLSGKRGEFHFSQIPHGSSLFIMAGSADDGATTAKSITSSVFSNKLDLTLGSPVDGTTIDPQKNSRALLESLSDGTLARLNLSGFNVNRLSPSTRGKQSALNVGKIYRLKGKGDALTGNIFALPDRQYAGQYAVYLVDSRGPVVVGAGNLSDLVWQGSGEPKLVAFSSMLEDVQADGDGVVGLRVIATSTTNFQADLVIADTPPAPQLSTQQTPTPGRRVIGRGSYTTNNLPNVRWFYNGSQAFWMRVKNGNVLGGQLQLEKGYPCTPQSIPPRLILPYTTSEWAFSPCLTKTPVAWKITASTNSDAVVMSYIGETKP